MDRRLILMEVVECGAACLAMILAYRGRWVPLEKLRDECGVSRDGSKAGNLLEMARQYGLTATGYRAELDDLHSHPLPMILFMNFAHFVILEGIRGDTHYLNDPASGPRKMDAGEFDGAYTGLVLSFEKEGPLVPALRCAFHQPTGCVQARLNGDSWLGIAGRPLEVTMART